MKGKYNRLPTGPGLSLTGFHQARSASDGGITNTLPLQAKRSRPDVQVNIKHGHGPKPQVTCWCECRVITSTWDKIKQGLGETCGAPGCHAPEEGTEV